MRLRECDEPASRTRADIPERLVLRVQLANDEEQLDVQDVLLPVSVIARRPETAPLHPI
jgi:hypothetical protein